MELLKKSNQIQADAYKILYEQGLLDIIKKYGDAQLTGSYVLETMLSKDIDISLINPSLDVEQFYKLGGELALLFNSPSIFYRDTRIEKVSGRPEGLYWGIFTSLDKTMAWKIDLWLVSKEYAVESEEYINHFKSKLTSEKRNIILQFKHQAIRRGCYGKKISSKEIYPAVLNEGMTSFEEFIRSL